MGFVKRIFGGGNKNPQPTTQPMVQQPTTPTPQQNEVATPAVAAPAVAESTQGNMQTGNGDTTLRKRRGKSALIIPNVNSNTGSSTGGGLNV